jgi:hypothetical protein
MRGFPSTYIKMKEGQLKFFEIKNFTKYQPRRNGKNAPWIRLYHGWNQDSAIGQLHDSHKAHYIGLLSIAHTENNRIPYDAKWIKMRGCFSSPVKLEVFMELGLIAFLDDKASLDTETSASGEKERKKEKKKEKNIQEAGCEIEASFEEDWEAYPRKDGVKIKALSCYKKTVGNNLPVNRPLFKKKMAAYVESVDDPGFLKHGETFFRNWQDLEVSNIKPMKNESWDEKHERELVDMRERLNARI